MIAGTKRLKQIRFAEISTDPVSLTGTLNVYQILPVFLSYFRSPQDESFLKLKPAKFGLIRQYLFSVNARWRTLQFLRSTIYLQVIAVENNHSVIANITSRLFQGSKFGSACEAQLAIGKKYSKNEKNNVEKFQ